MSSYNNLKKDNDSYGNSGNRSLPPESILQRSPSFKTCRNGLIDSFKLQGPKGHRDEFRVSKSYADQMCETILGASNLDPACYFCIPTDIVARIKTAIIEIIDFVSRWISRKDLSADEKKEYPEWNLDYAEREFLGLFLYGVFIGQISDVDMRLCGTAFKIFNVQNGIKMNGWLTTDVIDFDSQTLKLDREKFSAEFENLKFRDNFRKRRIH